MNARIIQLKIMISKSIKNILATLKQQQKIIDQKLARLEKKLKSLPKQEQDYIGLERNFLFNEKFYTYLMEKKTETEIKKAATINKNRILDTALLPKEPIKPKRKLIIAIGVILGLILGVVLAFIRAAFNNTIKEESDVKENTKAPLAGVIPKYKTINDERRLIVLDAPKSPEAEAFRNIRTNLQFMLKSKSHNIISITSTIAKEGKTSITANLAGTLHLLKKKTIILSLDLRKPTLHKIFELSNTKGISSYLSGEHKKEEVIRKTKFTYIDVIPSGPIPPNPNELIASEELSQLIDELKEEYDYVLLDTPPIGLVADTKVIVQHSNLTLYVIRADYSKKEFLNLVNELYEKDKMNLAIVLNGVKVSKRGYGYGYGSGYGYGYY
jgi:capsular exopolysaccharide synthesis family protein